MGIIILASWMILIVHLVEVLVWAGFFLWCGAMPTASLSYFLAVMDYTTLGSNYSLPERWRLFGRLDVLIHAAGGAVTGGLLEVTPEAWQGAFDVHVHAVYHLSRAAVPHIRQNGEGAIVLISSTAGKLGVIGSVAYQAVKGALPQLTRALARELAADNIRVNCVAPGVIRTKFHEKMSAEQKKLNLEQRIPLRREGTAAQVAEVILLLVQNDYMTGDTVTIDGGLTSRIA